jgi:tetratricopeptide (TPR) repeat protein
MAAGLTQPELGMSDVSVAYVSRIEKGERRPGPELLELFARRMRVNVEQLVLGDVPDVVRALELELDLAELELSGGGAAAARQRVEKALADVNLDRIPGGRIRARYVNAAAGDALGEGDAVAEYDALVAEDVVGVVALRAATALSRIHRERGDLDRAVADAQRGLELASAVSLEDTEDAVRLAVTLAAALYERGGVDEAAEVCRSAVERAERLHSPVARASAYWNTSVIEAEAGNVTRALVLAKKALQLMESADGVRDLARLRTQLGTIMMRVDPPQLDDARDQLEQASRELAWSQATPADRARNDLVTARLLFMSGDVEQATDHARAALDQLGDELPLVRAAGLTLLGQISWGGGKEKEARNAFASAIEVLTAYGNDREAAQLWFELGTLADEAGLTDQARDAYRRAAASSGLGVRNPASTGVDASAWATRT